MKSPSRTRISTEPGSTPISTVSRATQATRTTGIDVQVALTQAGDLRAEWETIVMELLQQPS